MLAYSFARPSHPAAPASAAVWKVLFDRQLALLHRRAVPAFGAGVSALGLRRDAPPELGALSRQLEKQAGWRLRPVGAPLAEADYYAALAQRELPVATRLRSFAEFDQPAGGPDLFADVFGRVPLLLEPRYAEFLAALGRVGAQAEPVAVSAVRRFRQATLEFGLLADPAAAERPQFFGGALLASARHTHHAAALVADPARRHPLAGAAAQLSAVPLTAGRGETAAYFVAESWAELHQELAAFAAQLAREAGAARLGPHAPAVPTPRVTRAAVFAARAGDLRQAG